MGIEQEAREGLQEYRESLISEFGDARESDERIGEIAEFLAELGLHVDSPAVIIPHETPSLERAVQIAKANPWYEPFAADRIGKARDKQRRLDAGESIYNVGPTTSFHDGILDIIVVFDTRESFTNIFGEEYTEAADTDLVAHETAHGAHKRHTNMAIRGHEDDKTVHISGRFGFAQSCFETTLSPGNSKLYEHNPVWLNESFATYIGTLARLRFHPQSAMDGMVNTGKRLLQSSGGKRLAVPGKYLINCTKYPDAPGASYAFVPSYGLEILNEKVPGLIDEIVDLSTDDGGLEDFHRKLKDSFGDKLYSNVTTPQPRSSWMSIHDQILEL